ncbi:hypothetical protein [Planktothricoides raciborskii]|uniref:Uncharacterized protein n=1 Tax=Planktothricoides raciborskii GIHE-MW2 TaxID=2792601 RepID=A0AAU8JC18_9CYAN|nr:hypothetical protein [Planktothricoides raciborskii]
MGAGFALALLQIRKYCIYRLIEIKIILVEFFFDSVLDFFATNAQLDLSQENIGERGSEEREERREKREERREKREERRESFPLS